MSFETTRSILLWTGILNYGVLLVWALVTLLLRDWLYRLGGPRLHLSREMFDGVNFAGIVFYKAAVLLFNLVPFVAMSIVR